jgi:hypothetical protein
VAAIAVLIAGTRCGAIEMLAAGSAGETAGFTVGQPHEIPGLVAGHIEAGADEVIFSFPLAETAGITAVGQAFGLGGQSRTPTPRVAG